MIRSIIQVQCKQQRATRPANGGHVPIELFALLHALDDLRQLRRVADDALDVELLVEPLVQLLRTQEHAVGLPVEGQAAGQAEVELDHFGRARTDQEQRPDVGAPFQQRVADAVEFGVRLFDDLRHL